MKRVITAQTPRVKMKDYKCFFGIFAPDVNSKINVRANILKCGIARADKLI